MPSLTRLPFQRSATAIFNPSANTTFSAMNPDQSTTYTVGVTRSFRPFRQTRIYFPSGLPAGLALGAINLTGAALTGWTVSYTLYNGTSSVITPAAQPVVIYQED